MGLYAGANRKAAGLALLILIAGMVVFVFTCAPWLKVPDQPVRVMELSSQRLPAKAAAALAGPHQRFFGNFAARLPTRGQNYYAEHRIEGGAEGERIVRGEGGEVYYTQDNFVTAYLVLLAR